MKQTDLEQIDTLQKLHAQLGYNLNQATQLKQLLFITEAQIDQKTLGLSVETGNPADIEGNIVLLIQSMRRCTARTVGNLKAISDRAGRGNNGRTVHVSAEEAEQPQQPATLPARAAAVNFEE